MQAAVIHEFGAPDVLRIQDVATPRPRPGHVLLKVLAAGINRIDHYIRAGELTPDIAFPHILGADAAGEVAALGAGVTDFAVGDRVIPVPGYPTRPEDAGIRPLVSAPSFTLPGLGIPGTYAQFIEVPAQARDGCHI